MKLLSYVEKVTYILSNLNENYGRYQCPILLENRQSSQSSQSTTKIIFSSEFLPSTLKNKFEHENEIIIQKKYYHSSTNITINLYYFENDKDIVCKWNFFDINEMILKIIFFMKEYCQVSPVFSNKPLRSLDTTCRNKSVHILLSNNKKELPPLRSRTFPRLLTASEINSAYTYRDACLEIVLFRMEELFKVFIHECIHSFGMDLIQLNHPRYFSSLDAFVNAHFWIHSQTSKNSPGFLYGEALTEATAVIFNTILYLSQHQLELSKHFKSYLNEEIQHSTSQCAKILLYFEFGSYEEFLKPSKLPQEPKKKPHIKQAEFSETTSVFCYYFVKLGLLYQKEDFISSLWEIDQRNEQKLLQNSLNILAFSTDFNNAINVEMKKLQDKKNEDIVNLKMCKFSLWE